MERITLQRAPSHRCSSIVRIETHNGEVPHRAAYCNCGKLIGNPTVVEFGAERQITGPRDAGRVFMTTSFVGTWLRLTQVNGAVAWVWRCGGCRFSQSIKHQLVPAAILGGVAGVDFDVKDNLSMAPQCDRCGSGDGTEYHHYAPSHLFDDADRWATGYLCRSCHTEWHRKTRTGAFYRSAQSA